MYGLIFDPEIDKCYGNKTKRSMRNFKQFVFIIILVLSAGCEEKRTHYTEYVNVFIGTEVEGLRRSHGWASDQYVYFVSIKIDLSGF